MTSDAHLSRLEQINDLRLVWRDEAAGFTPWLAGEGNMALLAETIGLELEVEGEEDELVCPGGSETSAHLCPETG